MLGEPSRKELLLRGRGAHYVRMALEIKKQFRESPQTLIRRFSQRVQKSGILRRARKIRYKTKEKSRQLKRRGALRREELKREYEKAQKIG